MLRPADASGHHLFTGAALLLVDACGYNDESCDGPANCAPSEPWPDDEGLGCKWNCEGSLDGVLVTKGCRCTAVPDDDDGGDVECVGLEPVRL